MAAALNQSPDLILDGPGHDLLMAWAPWARDDNIGGNGVAVGYLKPRLDRAHDGEPPRDYWIVDKIVAPHRRDRTNYWTAVAMFYLGERCLWEIAKELGPTWPEKRVMLNLVAFCALVEREFRDYNAAQ